MIRKCSDKDRLWKIHAEYEALRRKVKEGSIRGTDYIRIAEAKAYLSDWFGPACAKLKDVLDGLDPYQTNTKVQVAVAELAAAIGAEAVEFIAGIHYDRQEIHRDMLDMQKSFDTVKDHAQTLALRVQHLETQLSQTEAKLDESENERKDLTAKIIDLSRKTSSMTRQAPDAAKDIKVPQPQKWSPGKGRSVQEFLHEIEDYFTLMRYETNH